MEVGKIQKNCMYGVMLHPHGQIYKSERDINLVSRVPGVITCEDYCKWYNLYYIDYDGTVYKLTDKFPGIEDKNTGKVLAEPMSAWNIEYLDHTYNPRSVVEFALSNNLKIGRISMEAIMYRWMENYLYGSGSDLKQLKESTPWFKDAIKCLVEDYGVIEDYDLLSCSKETDTIYLFDDSQALNNICFRGQYGFYVTKTCDKSPEQYDAYDISGYVVGYIRARYGVLSVNCPTSMAIDYYGITMNLNTWDHIGVFDIPFAYPIIANTIRHYIAGEDQLNIKIGNVYDTKYEDLPKRVTVKDIVKTENGTKAVQFEETDIIIDTMEFHIMDGEGGFSLVKRAL